MDKQHFREDLKFISQTKVTLEEERLKETKYIEHIREIERDLNVTRAKINRLERLMLNRCDKCFLDVYDQLPNGEDNGETDGTGKEG